MTVGEVKQYLEKELPMFEYTTGKEAGQPEKNHNSIRILRDGQHTFFDISKIDSEKGCQQLKEHIEAMWARVEK
jgi:hypothetical protein